MTAFEAIILGIIQGLTEFLPVSSSGHLVLAQALMGIKNKGITFELMAHAGTLLSVVVYFRGKVTRLCLAPFRPLDREARRWFGYLILGTIPLLFIVPFKSSLERVYEMPDITSLLLVGTGLLLLLPRLLARRADGDLNAKSALWMGIGQAFAVLPGVSRSGSTIVSGLLCRVRPSVAAEFAFILAIPAISGSLILDLWGHRNNLDTTQISNYLYGFGAAFIFGLFAVYTVLATIRRGNFDRFAYYCFIAGISGFFYFHWVAPVNPL